MLDYTDISSKIEDIKNAIDNLYNLIYRQYDGFFKKRCGEISENASRY